MLPQVDHDLIAVLRVAHASMADMIDRLYQRRPGCACDAHGLCAYHAQVAEYIREAQVKLNQAVAYVEKSG